VWTSLVKDRSNFTLHRAGDCDAAVFRDTGLFAGIEMAISLPADHSYEPMCGLEKFDLLFNPFITLAYLASAFLVLPQVLYR
jgi:hypothetical protein